MSKESRFRKILENENQEEKQRVWKNIQAELNIDLSASAKKGSSFPWRILTASFSVLLVFAVGLGLFLHLLPLNQENGRYCTSSDYVVSQSSETIKDVAARKNISLLYFDWYDETDYLLDRVYKLKNNNEEICYYEEITDINTGCTVTIFILDDRTKLDLLSLDEDTKNTENIKNISVHWKFNETNSCANFEYKGNHYYLRAKEPISETYILDLVTVLLP